MMASKANEKTPEVKRSTVRIVVEDNYLPAIVSGDLWNKTPEEIAEMRETLGKFKDILTKAFQMFDQELSTRRSIHGTDYLKGVTHFRKPREAKAGNSLADDLTF